MWNNIRSGLAVLVATLLIGVGIVQSGTGTVTIKDASGTTQTYAIVTDGSGHFIAEHVICDYSAGANCAAVNSSHQLTTLEANSAAILSAIQGSIPAGTNYIGDVGQHGAPWTVDPGTAANWGVGAPAATAPAKAVLQGLRGASTDPAAVTDGQLVAPMGSLSGKTIILPYAIKELQVRGSATATDTGAHSIIASAGGSLKNYITDWECSNTSATTVRVTFSDDASTTVIVPAGGGNNKSLHVPLATAAATAFTMTSSGSASTIYCSAQGYTGL